jgi:hypothetical protein
VTTAPAGVLGNWSSGSTADSLADKEEAGEAASSASSWIWGRFLRISFGRHGQNLNVAKCKFKKRGSRFGSADSWLYILCVKNDHTYFVQFFGKYY